MQQHGGRTSINARRAVWTTVLAMGLVASALLGPGVAIAVEGGSHVYIVQLAELPVVAYDGGEPGYPATSARDGEHVNPNSANVRRYQDLLVARHGRALGNAGVPASAKLYDYTFAFNGFAASLNPAQVARLLREPNVVAVTPDEQRQLLTDNTPSELGLTGAGGLWGSGGSAGTVGEDVVIGVIDSGIWPEHPSFSDQADFSFKPGNQGRRTSVYAAPPSTWHGKCEAGEQFPATSCNNKLIGARWFARGNALAGGQHEGDYASPRDHDGHGTHTASTAGGNRGVNPVIFGRDLGVDTISGMAPRARIAAYKACFGETGCSLSDIVASIDAAVADGVDVINYSIGSTSPSSLATDPDAVAFLFAARAGVFVATSAGNSGQDAATIGSSADAPWVTSVGASTHGREFQNTVTLGDGATYTGGSVTSGVGPARLVDGGEECAAGLDPAVVAGAIVLCLRVTGIPRIEHGAHVAAAGGVGMILYDPPQSNVTPTDNHVLPTSTVEGPDGAAIAAYIQAAGDSATASFTAGIAVLTGDDREMAVFSSRGPNRAAPDIIKPDVTAPGVQILAGNSPTPFLGAPNQLFQAIQGTSMSSPHVAGIAALLVGAHPTWTPAMIRSALTTSGSQGVFKEDGATPADPFDFGGGHIQPAGANDPGLVYDLGAGDDTPDVPAVTEDYWEYLKFLCGSGDLDPEASPCTAPQIGTIDPSDLNLPSIGISQLVGVQTVTRTIRNVGPAGTYEVVATDPAGVDVAVSPTSMTLASGETATFSVTLTALASAAFDEWAFGSLTWSDGTHSVRSPIAVKPVPIAAPVEVSGTGVTGELSYDVAFGYDGPFETRVHGLVAAVVTNDTVVDDPASDIDVALQTEVGINLHTISVPAGTRHLRTALFDNEVDGETDDLDLYLYPPGEDPLNGGEFIAESAGVTAEEQIDIVAPEAGDWTLVVHGWETDGADAVYNLFTWLVDDADGGNLAATPSSATALAGQSATVTLTWGTPLEELAADSRYLGIVGYSDGVDEFGGTLVSITT